MAKVSVRIDIAVGEADAEAVESATVRLREELRLPGCGLCRGSESRPAADRRQGRRRARCFGHAPAYCAGFRFAVCGR